MLTLDKALATFGFPSFPGTRETRLAYFRTVRAEKDSDSERLAQLRLAFDTIKISNEAQGLFGLQSNVPLMASITFSTGAENEALELLPEFKAGQEEKCLAALRKGVAEGEPGYLELLGEMFAKRLSDDELELRSRMLAVFGGRSTPQTPTSRGRISELARAFCGRSGSRTNSTGWTIRIRSG